MPVLARDTSTRNTSTRNTSTRGHWDLNARSENSDQTIQKLKDMINTTYMLFHNRKGVENNTEILNIGAEWII